MLPILLEVTVGKKAITLHLAPNLIKSERPEHLLKCL
jgi:hypothetical protein